MSDDIRPYEFLLGRMDKLRATYEAFRAQERDEDRFPGPINPNLLLIAAILKGIEEALNVIGEVGE